MSDPAAVSERSAVRRVFERLWVQALVYAVLAIVLAASNLTAFWEVYSVLPQQPSPWWSLVTALPASALILIKRRWPLVGMFCVAVLFCVDLVTFGGVVVPIVLLEYVHVTVVRATPAQRRRILVALMVTVAVLALIALQRSGSTRVAILMALQLGALFGFTYWYAHSTAQSEELVALYRQRAADAHHLRELDREAALRGERARMAGELHDVVAGHVAAVAIRSEAALAAPVASGDDRAALAASVRADRAALQAVRDASLDAHAVLRSMISVLRRGAADGAVTVSLEQIPDLVAAGRESGLDIELRDEIPNGAQVNELAGGTVARVVQESLTNCLKHAAGARVSITLQRESTGAIAVEVTSTGGRPLAGFAGASPGTGLALLGERVRALGGEFFAGEGGGGSADAAAGVAAGAEPAAAAPAAAKPTAASPTWQVRAEIPQEVAT
ncbi:sensor histidine kinase [Leucobacter sp. NPDC058333]|uniref:sensor histidine kinase n=1 Tax=Leucobacter sp. NPDC058333 TaxID=3346450 RepID=UPI00364EC38B